jgi:hypothetical protein
VGEHRDTLHDNRIKYSKPMYYKNHFSYNKKETQITKKYIILQGTVCAMNLNELRFFSNVYHTTQDSLVHDKYTRNTETKYIII